jgi:serine/threonine protein kinase
MMRCDNQCHCFPCQCSQQSETMSCTTSLHLELTPPFTKQQPKSAIPWSSNPRRPRLRRPLNTITYFESHMCPSLNCLILSKLDKDFIKIVIYRVLTSLKYWHSNGLVHCDRKPENTLLRRAGSPQSAVLADFGYTHPVAGMPVGAEFLGSRCYAWPEARKSRPLRN